MAEPTKTDKQVTKEIGSGIDPDNSLLPMLIGGLVLIVLGVIIVMMFVQLPAAALGWEKFSRQKL